MFMYMYFNLQIFVILGSMDNVYLKRDQNKTLTCLNFFFFFFLFIPNNSNARFAVIILQQHRFSGYM